MSFVVIEPHYTRRAVGGLHPVTARISTADKAHERTGSRGAVAARSAIGYRILGHAVLLIVSFVSIFPIYWLFATAFRRTGDVGKTTLFPWPISTENFRTVFESLPLVSMVAHTFLMALVIAVCQMFLAILASYGFAMWEFPGKSLLFLVFLGSWLVPFQITMIPNYVTISHWGMLDTVIGVILPSIGSAFAVMLMRQHMTSFPRELIDAAHMDGRNHWGILWRVVLPNMRPALAALGIMLFIEAWNNYMWPAIVLQHKPNELLQMGLRAFLGGDQGTNWGATMAAAAMACIPIFLIYIFLQRYIVDAFVRSGLR